MKRFLTLLLLPLMALGQGGLTITPIGFFDPTAPGPIGGTTPSSGAFTTLSASSTVSGAGFTARFAIPGPIGSTTPSTGAFTTITASSTIQLTSKFVAGPTFAQVENSSYFGWSGDPFNVNGDLRLYRAGPAILRLGSDNAANDLGIQIPGLFTDASNYHYGSLAMSDTAFTISTQTLGTGVDNLNINLTPAGTGKVSVAGHLVFNITGPMIRDNTDYIDFTNNVQNAFMPLVYSLRGNSGAAPTIASAGTIAPTTPVAFISGTAAIATITAPVPITSLGGEITLIPTGIFTTTTGGNIALASTAVVSKALRMVYDPTTTKWYPSY